jgi:D-glycero-alpha-D-manno-heptose-7-phosphate kinase
MVISQTPLRISFVGGGSDLQAFAREHGGAVVSATIDKYIRIIVTERFDDSIRISYSQTEIVQRLDDVQHELVREALRAAGLPRKVEVVTVADVPSHGTGLGSSSAVLVGLLNALFAYQGILKSAQELATEAARIEIDLLGKPIGKQDHWAAAFGGVQFLQFGPGDEVRRDPVILSAAQRRELDRNLLMFYTGQQRSASAILEEVQDGVASAPAVKDALAAKRDSAVELFEELGSAPDLGVLGERLHQDWQRKKTLSPRIAMEEIDRAYDVALDAGATGGKLLGAGGGGFLLFYVPPERQQAVRAALSDLRELPFRLEPEGAKVVYIGR